MEAWHWISEHWPDLLQNLGIIGGLAFTAYSIWKDEKARRVANLFTIIQQHREIWKEMFEKPELARVLDVKADIQNHPISPEEQIFVNLLITHLGGVYRAASEGMFVELAGLEQDIRDFFSAPIPRQVWERMKRLQDGDFVRFIEKARRGD